MNIVTLKKLAKITLPIYFLVIFLLIVPQSAISQTGATSVNVDLDQTSQDANVETQSYPLEFTGEVRVITASSKTVYVKLKGEIENMDDHYLDITPDLMTFTSSDQDTFKVEITVPQGTLAGNYKLVVQVIWYHEGDEIPNEPQDSAEAYINVKQFYSLKIDVQAPYLYIGYGDSVDYFVSVQNTGNGVDTIDLDHDSPIGWILQLDAFKLKLDPQEIQVLKFTLITPSNPPLGAYVFNVNFTSSDNSILLGKFAIHAYVELDDTIVITGGNLPVLLTSARELNIGKINTGQERLIELNVKCYVETTEVEIQYEVLKLTSGDYTAETNLTIEISPSKQTIAAGSSKTFNLKIILNNSEYPAPKLKFTEIIRVQAVSIEYSNVIGVDLNSRSNKLTFDFVVINTNPVKSEPHFLTTVTGVTVTSSIIVAAAVGALAGGTEFGKYRFFSLLFVPLYTKIHKDKVLDHFTRGRVYEYIRNNPGSHYSLIKRELGLNNGGLTYHLRTLEREELIRARRAGIYKLFYTTKTQIPETIGLGLTPLQKKIVESIRTNPGITQTEIGAGIPDKSQRTISHHIKTMERKGLLVLEKDGRDTKCFIADTYEEILQGTADGEGDGVQDKPPVKGHEIKPGNGDMMIKEM